MLHQSCGTTDWNKATRPVIAAVVAGLIASVSTISCRRQNTDPAPSASTNNPPPRKAVAPADKPLLFTWAEFRARSPRLADAKEGDIVAIEGRALNLKIAPVVEVASDGDEVTFIYIKPGSHWSEEEVGKTVRVVGTIGFLEDSVSKDVRRIGEVQWVRQGFDGRVTTLTPLAGSRWGLGVE